MKSTRKFTLSFIINYLKLKINEPTWKESMMTQPWRCMQRPEWTTTRGGHVTSSYAIRARPSPGQNRRTRRNCAVSSSPSPSSGVQSIQRCSLFLVPPACFRPPRASLPSSRALHLPRSASSLLFACISFVGSWENRAFRSQGWDQVSAFRVLLRSPKLQIRGRSSPARRGSCWSCRTRRFRPLLVRFLLTLRFVFWDVVVTATLFFFFVSCVSCHLRCDRDVILFCVISGACVSSVCSFWGLPVWFCLNKSH